MGSARLDAQLAFLDEIDRLKTILRATKLNDASRHENTAEHSWHIAMYAMTLAEHAERPVDVARVIKMLLVHDIVEIDAGDTPIHADYDPAVKVQEEQAAADRIFGLLPEDQALTFRALWDEYETGESDDAVFARSVDRIQPLMSNLANGGNSWIDYGVTYEQVERRVGDKARPGAAKIWAHIQPRLRAWFERGTQKN